MTNSDLCEARSELAQGPDERVNVTDLVLAMGQQARQAQRALELAGPSRRTEALRAIAAQLRGQAKAIAAANRLDVEDAERHGQTIPFIERLTLDIDGVEGLALAIDKIARLEDPVGVVQERWRAPSGLLIERVSTAFGVVGMIFESRPNVAADAGALCLRSANAVILRCGSESLRTCRVIVAAMQSGLQLADLPVAAIQLVPVSDRSAVGSMLEGAGGTIDVVIPRGGRSLVERVQREARVPVFAHLEGICHVYVDADCDPKKAVAVVVNSKMRRTSVCGAAETVLLDRALPDIIQREVLSALLAAGCAIVGDDAIRALNSNVGLATEADWATEYIGPKIAARIVDGVGDAIDHINRWGSHHTDAIVTENRVSAQQFLREVDSAIVLHNASTQFADGGEFGFGGEMGIATGRMHARGPIGSAQLCTFKYQVLGNGEIRQ